MTNNKSERVLKLYNKRVLHLQNRIDIIKKVLPSLKGKFLETNQRQLRRLENKLFKSQLILES